jgi:hypothetical protein
MTLTVRTPLVEDFSQYVRVLQRCAEETQYAEDRTPYMRLLADAGAILANMTLSDDQRVISELIQAHDRLWGQSWLQDPVQANASQTYEAFKRRNGFGT